MKTKTILLDSHQLSYIEKVGNILASRVETVKLALLYTKLGIISPEPYKCDKKKTEIPLGPLGELLFDDSSYLRNCLAGLEKKLIPPENSGEKILTTFEMSLELSNNVDYLMNKYNLNFQKTVRAALIANYLLGCSTNEYNFSGKKERKTILIPKIIYNKLVNYGKEIRNSIYSLILMERKNNLAHEKIELLRTCRVKREGILYEENIIKNFSEPKENQQDSIEKWLKENNKKIISKNFF